MKIKKILTAWLIISAFLAASVYAGPRLRTYPKTLIAPSDSVSISWDDARTASSITQTCSVLYGNSPGNYTGAIGQSAFGALNFTPESAGLNGGVYYMRISETASGLVSSEFKMFVESNTAVSYLAPVNGAALNSLNPVLSWQAVSGVPYYSIAMFDTVPEIDIGSGSISITASVLWAGTTNGTGLEYPQPDPSGYYGRLDPPPLMQGLTYSWAIVNNYSGTPSMISDVFPGMRTFTVNAPCAAAAPVINSPKDGITLTASPVTLSWQASSGANNYKVYINQSGSVSGQLTGSASLPVYTAYTNSTSMQVPSNIGLNSSEYKWYVIALDNAGRGIKSTEEYFYFSTTVTAVNVHVTENDPVDGTVDVPQAIVYMDTVAGGAVNLYPFTCGDGGSFSYSLPYGDYKFTVMKEGFNTGVFYRTVSNTAVNADFTLTRAAYTLRGRLVESGSLVPVAGARITAELDGVTATADTLFDGTYALYLNTYGTWGIKAHKAGFSDKNTSITVADAALSLTYDASASDIQIIRNVNVLSGIVTNSMSQGINSVLVTAYETGNTSNSYSDTTDISGAYSINLPDGSFTVTAVKAGFVQPPSSSVSLSGSQSALRNFSMQDAANQVSGMVTRSGAPFEAVIVRAIPLAGTAVETQTDIFGNYVLSLGTGSYTIDAVVTGYTSDGVKNISFASGGNTVNNADFLMAENTSYVSGTVTQPGGVPLAGVMVTNGTASVLTNALGAYTLSMLSGSYSISASLTGYSSAGAQLVTLSPGQSVNNINFMLAPNAAQIRGTCYDVSGTAVAGADVYAITAGNTLTVSSDASGNFNFSVASGSWGVKAIKPGFTASQTITISLLPGQISSGNALTLGYDIGYVRGTVRDMSLAPVSGASVTILDASGTTRTITADTDGGYSAFIKPGGFSAYAGKSGWVNSAAIVSSVSAGNTVSNPVVVDFQITQSIKKVIGHVTYAGEIAVNADVTVIAPGLTVNAYTDANGDYSINIPGASNLVRVQIYKQLVTGATGVVTPNFPVPSAVNVRDADIPAAYGSLQMQITTSDSAAVNAIVSAGGVTKAASGASPFSFDMPLLDGYYDVYVSQNGYISVTRTSVMIVHNVAHDEGAVLLQAKTGISRTISGTVNDGTNPVTGASVSVYSGSTLVSTVVSGALGAFTVSGLIPGFYYVSAAKTGYTKSADTYLDVTGADSSGNILSLIPNTAAVYVRTVNSANSQVIAGAQAVLTGTGANTGNSGYGITADSGSVTITGLAAGNYNVTISRAGFTDETISVTAVNGSTVYNTVIMDPDPLTLGFAGGFVKTGAGTPVAGVTVKIYEQSNPAVVYSQVISAADGSYGNTLPAGSYSITASKDSYAISPAIKYINVPQAGIILSDFSASQQTGGGITISPPSSMIYNSGIGGPYVFTASYADPSGAIIPASFAWSCEPSSAGAINSAGIFTPTVSYIGGVRIKASALGKSETVSLNVYQKLLPGNSALMLYGEDGLSLSIPSASYSSANTIDSLTLITSDPGRARMTSGKLKVIGKVYSLTGGISFTQPMTLSLPVDTSYKTKGISMGLWNAQQLKWEQLSGAVNAANRVYAQVTHFSDYAVLSEMNPLSLDTAELTPNPFSPHRGGLNIDYAVSSVEASQVFVTIKVFSVTGELIRVIADNEPRNTGPRIRDKWDGYDKNGKLAANGRYLIQLEIKDPSGKKQHIFMAALVK